jgi:hypothetical protein
MISSQLVWIRYLFIYCYFLNSGYNRNTGVIVEQPGKDVMHISGRRILDNHSVNLISSVIMGILTPKIAYLVWP